MGECFILHLCTENHYIVLLESWATIGRYDFSSHCSSADSFPSHSPIDLDTDLDYIGQI